MGLTKQQQRPQPPLPSAVHRSAQDPHPVSPKVQMLKPLPSPFSAGNRFVQKELSPRAHPQVQLDPFRSKFRETLAAALSMDPDSDHHSGQQSAGNVSPVTSRRNPKRARMSDVHAGVVNASQIVPESEREIITDGATEERKGRIHKAQSLAVKIEEELFKLFGEVNKKYKAKSRSLVFNLKNKNNPALMERVLSGDISPKCLCAMTKEELASKELSEWRMDKTSVQEEVKESDDSVQDGVAETCNNNTSTDLEYPANEKSDMTQEPMVDDLQVTENLPEIMTLDEFLDLFYSETHFEDQSAGALQEDTSIDKVDRALKSESFSIAKDDAGALKFQFHSDLQSPQDDFESKLESPVNRSVSMLDPVVESKGDVIFKSPPQKVDAEKPDTLNGSIPESDMQCKISPDSALIHGSIWEGTIKLSLTKRTNIVAIFKSGEKLSTNEWPRLLGINGKMSLSELKKYLEELPKSRSRAITVTELCCKEGSPESVHHHLLKTIERYIANRRVGVVKVVEGVVMYLCPSHGKAAQILADHLPKEHLGSLTETKTCIIGLIVWKRPNVSRKVPTMQDVPKSQATSSSSVLPIISQPPSRSSNARHSHQDVVPKSRAKISGSVLPMISQPPARSSNARRPRQDVETADVLPGFGPGVVKDENSADSVATSQTYMSHWHTSLAEDEIKEMVLKYGDISVAAQPWNREGDESASIVHKHGNLPEGNPNSQSNLQQAQIPTPQLPYQQLRRHSDMPRESQIPLPQAYPWNQHFAMPVQQPLTYGHLMHSAWASYYGILGRGGQSHFAAPDCSRTSGAWKRG